MPKNAQAIKDWVIKNRPDLAPRIDELMEKDSFIFVAAIGFEAGRQFQLENPNLPMGPKAYL